MRARRMKNREDVIRLQIKLSQLKTQNKRASEELSTVTTTNEKLDKTNEILVGQNEKLNSNIGLMVMRIDLNTLLKEIDIEEMKL